MATFEIEGFDEIANIIKLLGQAPENQLDEATTICENGITYQYTSDSHKKSLTISSDDGRNMTIDFKPYRNLYSLDPYTSKITFLLSDGSQLELERLNSFPTSGKDLLEKLVMEFCDRENAGEAVLLIIDKNVNDVRLAYDGPSWWPNWKEKYYRFTKNGIKYKDFIFSLDGQEIVAYKREPVNIGEVNSFNYQKERELLEAYSKVICVHPFTKELLDKALEELAKKKEQIDTFLKEIEDVQKVVDGRVKVVDTLVSRTFTSEELDAVATSFEKRIKSNEYRKGTKK